MGEQNTQNAPNTPNTPRALGAQKVNKRKLRKELLKITGVDCNVATILKERDIYTVVYEDGRRVPVSSGYCQQLINRAKD
jgi:hypothetical protein